MNIYLIDCLIKFIGFYICVCYSFFKIIGYTKLTISKKGFILLLIVILSFMQYFLQSCTNTMIRVLIITSLYSYLLSKISELNIKVSFIVTFASLAFTYIISFISTILVTIVLHLIFNIPYTNPVILLIIDLLNIGFTFYFFKVKKFKNGFTIIKSQLDKSYIDILFLIIIVIVLFMNFVSNVLSDISGMYLVFSFLILIILSILIVQKTFTVTHKHKNLIKNIKYTEQELSETKQKLETALSEKRNLVQSNHEFYHRQKALSQKLDELMILQAHSADTEVSEEISDIIDRINKMSDEYKTKTHTLPNLEKCNIKSIDDMFSYMQYECYKNDIEFILKYNCDINHIINNNINESQLETLLGDFIRNSIIAINHSENSYRSIMVVFGIKDDAYELCVFDSGIPFEINTLINLGLQPASTHLDEGGTGSGFISTFETINSCNASFIINEITGTNYTKSLEIKFDNKHEYIIISDRSNEIKKLNVSNRSIILK